MGELRTRNPRGKGDRLHEELLDAATELVAEHRGFDGVSLRAIATRAGVSPTAVYRHFPDAEALLHAAVERCFTSFAAAMDAETEGAEDPFERLAGAGTAYVRFATEHTGHYRAMFSSEWRFEEENVIGQAAFEQLVSMVAGCLEALGDTRDPRFVAYQLWSWIHGIVDLRITQCNIEWPPIDDMLEGMVDRLGLVER